jgi:hypothetical protein
MLAKETGEVRFELQRWIGRDIHQSVEGGKIIKAKCLKEVILLVFIVLYLYCSLPVTLFILLPFLLLIGKGRKKVIPTSLEILLLIIFSLVGTWAYVILFYGVNDAGTSADLRTASIAVLLGGSSFILTFLNPLIWIFGKISDRARRKYLWFFVLALLLIGSFCLYVEVSKEKPTRFGLRYNEVKLGEVGLP